MHISIIAAMSKDLVLGSSKEANRFGLLWDIPEDRKLFKSLTAKYIFLFTDNNIYLTEKR